MLYRCSYDDCANHDICRDVAEDDAGAPVFADAVLCAGCGRILDRLPNGPDGKPEHTPSERPPEPEPPGEKELEAAAALQSAVDSAVARREKLVAKIRSGSATDAERDEALARLLEKAPLDA